MHTLCAIICIMNSFKKILSQHSKSAFLALAVLFSAALSSLPENARAGSAEDGASVTTKGVGQNIDKPDAFDTASASWLQVHGEKPFLQAKPWVAKAAQAMHRMGWFSANTQISIAMLDQRGNVARFNNSTKACRVQVSIDEQGSSAVIRALGGFGSSISFVTAHELAHCHFDALSTADGMPTADMLERAGASKALVSHLMSVFAAPTAANGGEALVLAYEEAVADAAAAIALRADEERSGSTARYGSALQKAESLRFGALAPAIHSKEALNIHQGAFTFAAVAKLPIKQLNWDQAREIALQSVLTSSFSAKEMPLWLHEQPAANKPQSVEQSATDARNFAQSWKLKGQALLAKRALGDDELRFRQATATSLFVFNQIDVQGDAKDNDEQAMRRWRSIAWIGSADL